MLFGKENSHAIMISVKSSHAWMSHTQRRTESGFQKSNPAGFSTFWTNRIGSGQRFYSSYRIKIRIFKSHFWNLTSTQSWKNSCKDLKM